MIKSDICLRDGSKKNTPFLKTFAPKNAPIPLMPQTDPGNAA